MEKFDLVYDILCRLEKKIDQRMDKMDDRIDNIEDKVDEHRSKPHTISLSAKQITAITGILAVIFGAITTIAKMVIG